MWGILFYIDHCIIYKIFDPFLVRLCRLIGKDNFWCGRVWWKIMHGSLFLWGLYLVLFEQRIFVGNMIIISMGIVLVCTSNVLWRSLCHMFKKRSLRHPYEKELSGIKYQIYVQGFNPLILAQARLRIYNTITLLCVMPIIGYIVMPFREVFVLWQIIFAYNCTYLIYLYMRACMVGIIAQSDTTI
jgi:hypothetical protein